MGGYSSNDCVPDKDSSAGNQTAASHLLCPNPANVTANPYMDIALDCYPATLSAKAKFGYTLFFLVVPWPFFIYEFFTSRYRRSRIIPVKVKISC